MNRTKAFLVGLLIVGGLLIGLLYVLRSSMPNGASTVPPVTQDQTTAVATTTPPVGLAAENGAGAAEQDSSDQQELTPLSKMFRTILERYTLVASHPGATMYGETRFELESMFHFREARLFALVHPDAAEKLASDLAKDVSANDDERKFGFYMLKVLAGQGRSKAEQALYDVASGSNTRLTAWALQYLGEVDDKGRYRSLYLKRCQEFVGTGFHAISYWNDNAAVAILRNLADGPPPKPSPRGESPLAAQVALDRISIIQAPDWEVRVTEILEKKAPDSANLTPWALRIARIRSVPGLRDILRRRMDIAEQNGREPKGLFINHEFEKDFVTARFVGVMNEFHFDEMLLAYMELGGELNDLEKKRLRYAGYAVDPKERLAELMKPQGR